MSVLNKILLDVAPPPLVTKASIATDNTGAISIIAVLAITAAAVAVASLLVILAIRGKRKATYEECKEIEQHAV